MEIVLIIYLLSVEGSYAKNEEYSVEQFADTVQWVLTEDDLWRIRTFAIDEDVHVIHANMEQHKTKSERVEIARQLTRKRYGDIVYREVLLNSETGIEGIKEKLEENGLVAHLNVSQKGFFFWAPPNTRYTTKTRPN